MEFYTKINVKLIQNYQNKVIRGTDSATDYIRNSDLHLVTKEIKINAIRYITKPFDLITLRKLLLK